MATSAWDVVDFPWVPPDRFSDMCMCHLPPILVFPVDATVNRTSLCTHTSARKLVSHEMECWPMGDRSHWGHSFFCPSPDRWSSDTACVAQELSEMPLWLSIMGLLLSVITGVWRLQCAQTGFLGVGGGELVHKGLFRTRGSHQV